MEAADKGWWTPGSKVNEQVESCHAALNALPDVSAEQEARDYLVVAQDRYGKTSTGILEEIYDNVAEDFSNYCRIINRDDEEQFVGKLKSAPAKLNFNVDFYGRGLFPPGAYHSGGHQDGMGLCLYLALMKHTLGEDFTFTVSIHSMNRLHHVVIPATLVLLAVFLITTVSLLRRGDKRPCLCFGANRDDSVDISSLVRILMLLATELSLYWYLFLGDDPVAATTEYAAATSIETVAVAALTLVLLGWCFAFPKFYRAWRVVRT